MGEALQIEISERQREAAASLLAVGVRAVCGVRRALAPEVLGTARRARRASRGCNGRATEHPVRGVRGSGAARDCGPFVKALGATPRAAPGEWRALLPAGERPADPRAAKKRKRNRGHPIGKLGRPHFQWPPDASSRHHFEAPRGIVISSALVFGGGWPKASKPPNSERFRGVPNFRGISAERDGKSGGADIERPRGALAGLPARVTGERLRVVVHRAGVALGQQRAALAALGVHR